jgi:hypothetical protein
MYRRLDAVSLDLEEAGSQHRSSFDFMLRRASRREVPPAVHTFFGLVEPLRLGAYREQHPIDQLTPLVALGDIAVADPPAARRLAGKITAFLQGDAGLQRDLVDEFRSWQELKPALANLSRTAPAFGDAAGTATDLGELGLAGQEALAFITGKKSPPQDWVRRQAALLDHARIAKGVLRVAVVDALQQLITAANSVSP